VPAELASLVERALAIDPAERPSDAVIAEGLAQPIVVDAERFALPEPG
jgi:hypothetical protein